MTPKPNEHVTAWIGAYHDGELSGALLRQVEDHLSACRACLAELEALDTLSSVLHEAPAPALNASPDVYASRIMLRLPREQKRSVRQRVQSALPAAWRYAPAALFTGWAFFQAVLLVSAALLWLIRIVPQARAAFGWLPLSDAEPGGLLNLGAVLDPLLLADVALTAVTVALFAAWLASWWAVHRSPGVMENQKVTTQMGKGL